MSTSLVEYFYIASAYCLYGKSYSAPSGYTQTYLMENMGLTGF